MTTMNSYLFIFNDLAKKSTHDIECWSNDKNKFYVEKKLVAGLYVDRIFFASFNEYLKIGIFFFLTSCIMLFALSFIELSKLL